MSSHDPIPGLSGLVAIAVGVIVVSMLMTLLVNSYLHWAPVILGLAVGLMAIKAIAG